MMDLISWYLESVSAFFVSLASGGFFRLILIACLLYWIFGGRRRWRCRGGRCSGCGCWCGTCLCEDDEDSDDGDDEDGDDDEVDEDVVDAEVVEE